MPKSTTTRRARKAPSRKAPSEATVRRVERAMNRMLERHVNPLIRGKRPQVSAETASNGEQREAAITVNREDIARVRDLLELLRREIGEIAERLQDSDLSPAERLAAFGRRVDTVASQARNLLDQALISTVILPKAAPSDQGGAA